MDTGSYTFKSLESKYDGFVAPAFELVVGGKTIDGAKQHISNLTVELNAEGQAGGCSFIMESLFDYASGKWTTPFGQIQVGAVLQVKIGYVKKKEVFFGFVDELRREFSADSPPRISVTGIDAFGFLMSLRSTAYANKKNTQQFIRELLQPAIAAGYAKKTTIGKLNTPKVEQIIDGVDDFHYLIKVAEQNFAEFFVLNGEIILKSVHDVKKPIIELTLGIGLFSFQETLSMRGQVGKVIVDSLDAEHKAISGEASTPAAIGSGDAAVKQAKQFKKAERRITDLSLTTQEECKQRAQSILDKITMGFSSGMGRCIGLPELIPGRYITLSGMSRGKQTYFITQVSHSFSPEGYLTTFSTKGSQASAG